MAKTEASVDVESIDSGFLQRYALPWLAITTCPESLRDLAPWRESSVLNTPPSQTRGPWPEQSTRPLLFSASGKQSPRFVAWPSRHTKLLKPALNDAKIAAPESFSATGVVPVLGLTSITVAVYRAFETWTLMLSCIPHAEATTHAVPMPTASALSLNTATTSGSRDCQLGVTVPLPHVKNRAVKGKRRPSTAIPECVEATCTAPSQFASVPDVPESCSHAAATPANTTPKATRSAAPPLTPTGCFNIP
jgi:hypothetical protein